MLLIEHRDLESGGAVMVAPRGPLDSATAPALGSAIEGLAREKGAFIILDAAGIEHISSAGIGMVLHIHRTLATEGGALTICNLPGETLSIFRLIGFDRILDIASTLEEAEGLIAGRRAGMPSPAAPATRPDRNEEESPKPPEDRITGDASNGLTGPAEAGFDQALVVECAECGGLVRVRRSGTYQCPHCRAEFSVEKDRTIIF